MKKRGQLTLESAYNSPIILIEPEASIERFWVVYSKLDLFLYKSGQIHVFNFQSNGLRKWDLGSREPLSHYRTFDFAREVQWVQVEKWCVFFGTSSGELFVYGEDYLNTGLLGLGQTVRTTNGIQQVYIADNSAKIKGFVVDKKYCLALMEGGDLYFWGSFNKAEGENIEGAEGKKSYFPVLVHRGVGEDKVFCKGKYVYLFNRDKGIIRTFGLFDKSEKGENIVKSGVEGLRGWGVEVLRIGEDGVWFYDNVGGQTRLLVRDNKEEVSVLAEGFDPSTFMILDFCMCFLEGSDGDKIRRIEFNGVNPRRNRRETIELPKGVLVSREGPMMNRNSMFGFLELEVDGLRASGVEGLSQGELKIGEWVFETLLIKRGEGGSVRGWEETESAKGSLSGGYTLNSEESNKVEHSMMKVIAPRSMTMRSRGDDIGKPEFFTERPRRVESLKGDESLEGRDESLRGYYDTLKDRDESLIGRVEGLRGPYESMRERIDSFRLDGSHPKRFDSPPRGDSATLLDGTSFVDRLRLYRRAVQFGDSTPTPTAQKLESLRNRLESLRTRPSATRPEPEDSDPFGSHRASLSNSDPRHPPTETVRPSIPKAAANSAFLCLHALTFSPLREGLQAMKEPTKRWVALTKLAKMVNSKVRRAVEGLRCSAAARRKLSVIFCAERKRIASLVIDDLVLLARVGAGGKRLVKGIIEAMKGKQVAVMRELVKRPRRSKADLIRAIKDSESLVLHGTGEKHELVRAEALGVEGLRVEALRGESVQLESNIHRHEPMRVDQVENKQVREGLRSSCFACNLSALNNSTARNDDNLLFSDFKPARSIALLEQRRGSQELGGRSPDNFHKLFGQQEPNQSSVVVNKYAPGDDPAALAAFPTPEGRRDPSPPTVGCRVEGLRGSSQEGKTHSPIPGVEVCGVEGLRAPVLEGCGRRLEDHFDFEAHNSLQELFKNESFSRLDLTSYLKESLPETEFAKYCDIIFNSKKKINYNFSFERVNDSGAKKKLSTRGEDDYDESINIERILKDSDQLLPTPAKTRRSETTFLNIINIEKDTNTDFEPNIIIQPLSTQPLNTQHLNTSTPGPNPDIPPPRLRPPSPATHSPQRGSHPQAASSRNPRGIHSEGQLHALGQ